MNASPILRMALAQRTVAHEPNLVAVLPKWQDFRPSPPVWAHEPEPFQDGGLRPMQYTLTRSQVHRHAAHLLQAHLRLTDFRSRCPARTLLDLLLAAASWLTSLSAACLRLLRAPCPETARLALRHWLPAQEEL